MFVFSVWRYGSAVLRRACAAAAHTSIPTFRITTFLSQLLRRAHTAGPGVDRALLPSGMAVCIRTGCAALDSPLGNGTSAVWACSGCRVQFAGCAA